MEIESCETAASNRQQNAERRHPRFFLSAPVIARRPLNSGSHVTRGITLDISLGGVSAVLCGPPPVGERVSVRMKLMNSAFEAPAIVRHSSPARTGFEFVSLSPESQRRIEKCIRRSLLAPWPKDAEVQVV
jgi:c-di-GMP-binding flagellar brake protein YcgR